MKKEIEKSCWNCCKKGDFAGNVCPKCFDKMEEVYFQQQLDEAEKEKNQP